MESPSIDANGNSTYSKWSNASNVVRALFYPAACKYLTVPAVPRFVRVHEFLLLAERGDKWRAGFPRFVVDRIRGRQCQGRRTKGRMRGSRRVGWDASRTTPRQGLTGSLNTPWTRIHTGRNSSPSGRKLLFLDISKGKWIGSDDSTRDRFHWSGINSL